MKIAFDRLNEELFLFTEGRRHPVWYRSEWNKMLRLLLPCSNTFETG